MNGMYGMDPSKATKAMQMIQTKKAALDKETNNATTALKGLVNKAFFGTQTNAMNDFILKINGALMELYKYLDGKESNFAQTFQNAINSYVKSDANINQTYSSSQVK